MKKLKIPSYAHPLLWIFGGVILVLAAVIVGELFLTASSDRGYYLSAITVELLKTAGASLIVVGGINAIIEIGHWRQYFEERLKEIVLEQNYLDSLDKKVLSNLHVKLLQAQFKDSLIGGDGSFFGFYNKHIHSYIGDPFREDAVACVAISEGNENSPWQVHETIQFNCRKNGGSIQKSISWAPNEHETLKSIVVSLRLPESEEDQEVFREPKEGSGGSVDESALDKLKDGIELDAITLPNVSQKLSAIDKLGVRIETTYSLKRYSAITWSFVLPTKRFRLTVLAEKNYEMAYEMFCANESGLKVDRSPGSLLLHYSDWMLPQNGVIVKVLPKQL